MSHRSLSMVLIPMALIAASGQVQFKASISLVRLELQVIDSRGHVGGLKAGDFVVEDRGERQSVRMEEFTDAPLDVIMVAPPLAAVTYIAADRVDDFTAAVNASFEQVQDRDRLGVVLAASAPRRLRPLQTGRPAFGIEAFDTSQEPYAAPYDAIAIGLRMFEASDRRQVMVAFGGAADFRSVISADVVAELAGRLGPAFVLVSSPVSFHRTVSGRTEIGVSGRLMRDPVAARIAADIIPATLQRLADRSRGTLVNLSDAEPGALIEQAFTSLRSGYVVTYELPRATGWHPVKVEVKRRGARVAVREGYFIE